MKKIFVILMLLMLLTSCNKKQTQIYIQKPFVSVVNAEINGLKVEFELNYVSSNEANLTIINPNNLKGLEYSKNNESVFLNKNKLTNTDDSILCFFEILNDFGEKEIFVNNKKDDFLYINNEFFNYKVVIDTTSNCIKSVEADDLLFIFRY